MKKILSQNIFLVCFVGLLLCGFLSSGLSTRTAIASCTIAVTPATNLTSTAKCYREGQHLIVDGKITAAGAGDAGVITLSLASVTGTPVIDTAAIVGGTGATNQTATDLGRGKWFDAGNGWLPLWPVYKTTTTIEIDMGTQVLDGAQLASGDAVNYHLELPIVGYQ